MNKKITGMVSTALVGVLGIFLWGATSDSEWSEIKKNFQADYNKPEAKSGKDAGSLRVSAIKKLAGVEHPQMVDLLIKTVIPAELNGDYPPAIDALVAILGQLKDENCLKELVAQAKETTVPVKIVVIQAMASLNNPMVTEALISFLTSSDNRLKISAIDALANTCPKEALGTILKELSASGGKDWEIRSSVTNYLTKLTDEESRKSAVDALAKQSAQESGRPREEMLKAITLLSGKDVTPDKSKETIAVFYGFNITSKNLVFVVDISGSMKMYKAKEGVSRFDVLIKELKSAINHLPADTKFNIIAFNDNIYPWQKSQMPVKQYQKAALDWIDTLKADKATNIFGALETAFGFASDTKTPVNGYYTMKAGGVDTIYFMTDGSATTGRYLEPAEIISAIHTLNKTRKIQINTIAMGVGGGELIPDAMSGLTRPPPGAMGGKARGEVDTEFLKKLAEDNYGVAVEK